MSRSDRPRVGLLKATFPMHVKATDKRIRVSSVPWLQLA